MMITQAFTRYKSDLAIVMALVLASALCGAMYAARVAYTGHLYYFFMLWNLFLAWIPLLCAFAARAAYARRTWLRYPAFLLCAFFWLLFFPNALYVMTDLIHLRAQPDLPLWFDATLFVTFAWTGLCLGFVSLYLMHGLVARSLGWVAGWLFALTSLGLSGFGVYLGRFLGWNSWDLLFQPTDLLAAVWDQVRHPLAHSRTYAVSLLFAAFFIAAYFVLFAFKHLQPERSVVSDRQ
jgi:uncharacterized membrane protein